MIGNTVTNLAVQRRNVHPKLMCNSLWSNQPIQTMNDPIVNEIRKFQDEHAKMFNYDIKAICDDYRKKRKFYAEKLAKMKNEKTESNKQA